MSVMNYKCLGSSFVRVPSLSRNEQSVDVCVINGAGWLCERQKKNKEKER